MQNDIEFKSKMAKRVASFGSNVSVEKINEIMTMSAIPGNKVKVTKEEASACGIESFSTKELNSMFGSNSWELSEEAAYHGVETEEFQNYLKNK